MSRRLFWAQGSSESGETPLWNGSVSMDGWEQLRGLSLHRLPHHTGIDNEDKIERRDMGYQIM